MNYQKKPLSVILRSPWTVFTFQDICLLWGTTDAKAAIEMVNYYVRTGGLYRIRRGVYAKDANYDALELASRIFTPAYVSFETVLVRSGINFQHYGQIFVASYLTREITVDKRTYRFRKIKESVLIEPAGIDRDNGRSMATPERAFLDTIYIQKDYHFDNLGGLDWDKVFQLLPMYRNQRMVAKVDEFYSHHQSMK
jgi:hypothetical protein